jgi:hypothetical protein
VRRTRIVATRWRSSLAPLNEVRTPAALGSVMNEGASYVLAGAFVGFLVERHGLPRFRGVYETGDYAKAYGRSFATLEREWRASVPR